MLQAWVSRNIKDILNFKHSSELRIDVSKEIAKITEADLDLQMMVSVIHSLEMVVAGTHSCLVMYVMYCNGLILFQVSLS